MSEELRTIKFQMMLSASEAETLDNFQYQNRFRSRAAAIRYLWNMALQDNETPQIRRENIEITDELSQLRERNAELERVVSSIHLLASSIQEQK